MIREMNISGNQDYGQQILNNSEGNQITKKKNK